jgi:hypothetical protein
MQAHKKGTKKKRTPGTIIIAATDKGNTLRSPSHPALIAAMTTAKANTTINKQAAQHRVGTTTFPPSPSDDIKPAQKTQPTHAITAGNKAAKYGSHSMSQWPSHLPSKGWLQLYGNANNGATTHSHIMIIQQDAVWATSLHSLSNRAPISITLYRSREDRNERHVDPTS